MALKFRRGNASQKSGSLQFGEPYVNTDLNTLQVGGASGDITLATTGENASFNGLSVSASSFVSASNLHITNNATVKGDLTLGGKITIGDAALDTVNVVASLSSSLIPSDTNAFDLGSANKIWRDLYISTGSIKFVEGNTVVKTITANTITALETATGSSNVSISNLNSFTSSINDTIKTQLNANTVVSGSSQLTNSFDARYVLSGSITQTTWDNIASKPSGIVSGSSQVIDILTSLNSYTSSNNTTNTAQNGRLTNLESTSASLLIETANLETFSSSTLTRLTNIESTTASINTLNTTQTSRLDQLSTASGSAITRLSALEVETVNLETFSASTLTRLSNIETFSGSENTKAGTLATYTGSIDTKFSTLATYTGSVDTKFSTLATYTASNDTTNTTQTSRLDQLSTASGSAIGRLNNLETFSGSENTKAGTLATYTASVDTKFSTLATYTGSNDTKWNTLGSLSGSFARTNSANTFNGNQIVSGSLTVTQDMIVLGSSSIQTISASTLNIGTNIITVAVNQPSVRFGGLSVIDSGSAGASGSFLYDSVEDDFIFVHRAVSGSSVTSSVFILGPETINNLGNETYLTNNRVPKGSGREHLNDSNISDTGTLITLGSNTVVNGTLVASGTTLVSSSAQVVGILTSLNSYTASNDTTNTTQNSRLDQLSTASGSAITRLSALEVETLNLETFSSSALTRLSTLEVETANLEAFTSSINTTIKNRLNAETVISGSSQVTAASTTGFATDVKTQLDANTVVSGSGQINIASTTGDIALGTRTSGNYVASLVAGTNITLTNNSGEGATPTIGLTNNTISGIALGSNLATLTIGTGLSGTSYNGSTAVTIANSGVTSNVAGTGISVSGATGAVTITNTGVTSAVAGTGVTVSGATGAVTISIGQAVATSSNVQFNSLGVGMAASATAGRIDATNDIVAFSSSDIRFKENIKPIENAIDKIRKISGNTYDWKEENKIEHGYEGNDVGVIAQEIEAVLPQLVQTRESGYKAVKYDKLVALLIEGIKEQQLQIEQLRIDLDNCRNNKGL